mmetsp:Transcript_20980/g.49156  ORF Transcript_20980/g.49156 Transcript_20980/m.49156 type:complete len:209 (+) Transcript_20980:1042-1668(+)
MLGEESLPVEGRQRLCRYFDIEAIGAAGQTLPQHWPKLRDQALHRGKTSCNCSVNCGICSQAQRQNLPCGVMDLDLQEVHVGQSTQRCAGCLHCLHGADTQMAKQRRDAHFEDSLWRLISTLEALQCYHSGDCCFAASCIKPSPAAQVGQQLCSTPPLAKWNSQAGVAQELSCLRSFAAFLDVGRRQQFQSVLFHVVLSTTEQSHGPA